MLRLGDDRRLPSALVLGWIRRNYQIPMLFAVRLLHHG